MAADHFENLVRLLLESDGYWVTQSFKVNLSKEEKRRIGKHSIPRPEIDLLAFSFSKNEVVAMEAKSYLDSGKVRAREVMAEFKVPEGKYKLFTCKNYCDVVTARLKEDLIAAKMANRQTTIRLGLVIGNVHEKDVPMIRGHAKLSNWLYWSPRLLKRKLRRQAARGYENDPAVITAKLLLRT